MAVLSGLLRKRQATADKMEATQAKQRRLVLDIDAADATSGCSTRRASSASCAAATDLVPASGDPGQAQPPRPCCREAQGPMTRRGVVFRVTQARGLLAADKPKAYTMHYCRVKAPLRGLRERGSLHSSRDKGVSVKW